MLIDVLKRKNEMSIRSHIWNERINQVYTEINNIVNVVKEKLYIITSL